MKYMPAAIPLALLMPLTKMGVKLRAVDVLIPSCPLSLVPQHMTAPVLSTAQVWSKPAETLVAVDMPETSTGVALSVVVLLPSWP